ncbi:MAG TPA: IclR family transcriptional regulator [Longimicrobiales bacterium]|nr:IclR family transcriptional regulator [Longimicrobiales bacterium]
MIEHVMEVLDLFNASRREIGVIEAAELLGRPRSTTSRWLSRMLTAGFLDRDPDSGRYRVSMRLSAVGELARQAIPLQRLAYPWLEQITASTGETSNLVLLGADGIGINVEAVESPRQVAHMGAVGRRFPLHASAAGKALLAWRSTEEVKSLLSFPLERRTANTIADLDALLVELAAVRVRGYAVNWAESEDDLVGIAAPVRDHRDEVICALSISAPVWRVSRDDLPRLGRQIVDPAMSLSRSLGWRGPDG